MKMLDLAVGEWVATRGGKICKIIGSGEEFFELREAILNGFGQVLWFETIFRVTKMGKMRGQKYPHWNDIANKVTWRNGGFLWLTEKTVLMDLKYIDI